MVITAGTHLGRYEIRSKIGAGGMGEVHLAEDTSELEGKVALKIISAEVAKDKDRLQRFTQDARTVSNLNHPNCELDRQSSQGNEPAFNIAQIYLGLGDNEQALASLEKAGDEQSVWLIWLGVDPKFDPPCSDPRFKEMLKRLNLPE